MAIIAGTKEPNFDISDNNQSEKEIIKAEQGAGLFKPFDEEDIDKSKDIVNQEKFDSDDKIDTEEYTDTNESIDESSLDNKTKIEENPNSPLIDGFVEQKLLSFNEGNLIKNELIKGGKISENILKIKGIDNEKLIQVSSSIDFLDTKEVQSKNLEKFNNDFSSEVDGLKVEVKPGKKKGIKDFVGKKETTRQLVGRNKELVEMLGGNYLNLTNKEGKSELNKESLDRSFKTTLNKLMKGKSFKRPDTFENTVKKIKNSELSFKERFEELKKIDNLINDDQSRAIGKSKNAYVHGVEAREEETFSLQEKFSLFKEELKQAKERKNREVLEELLEVANELLENSKENGDIFIASEVDTLKEDIQDILKEQA